MRKINNIIIGDAFKFNYIICTQLSEQFIFFLQWGYHSSINVNANEYNTFQHLVTVETIYVNPFSAGTDYMRQNLTFKVNPRTA